MTVEIVARPDPFRTETLCTEMPEGLSIAEMLTGRPEPMPEAPGFVVYLGDRRVPNSQLHRVRPKAGTRVTAQVVLHRGGGGGEGGGKDTMRTVATIAVIAAAMIVGPMVGASLFGVAAGTAVLGGVTAGAVGTALVGTAGMLAVSALAPPRAPSISSSGLSQTSGQAVQDSPNYSIAGARNQLQPFGVVPAVLGRHRMVPPMGARPFTEILGDDQYLRLLVIWGYGPLKISDIKIGETPITSFDDVEIETREGRDTDAPLTLYPSQVTETDPAVSLTAAAGWQTRTTEPDTDEISIDLTFPGGLIEFDLSGNRVTRQVSVEIHYRRAGVGSFTSAGFLNVTAASTQPVRRGHRFSVPRGQYDVALRRVTADTTSAQIVDQVVWSALRSFTNEDPIAFSRPLAKSAIRIRATDQLNGVVDQINAMVESEVLDLNGAEWVAGVSRNPASLFRHVLQGAANENAVADAEIDLEELQAWHAFNAANGFTFSHVRDFGTSVWETLADIAAAGRAAPAMRDGRWGVMVDQVNSMIAQHFTPTNSWSFQGAKLFGQRPHGWRVRFVNEENDAFRQDELIVYDDGFDESNATLFEALEFPGVTDSDQIWKLGRYHIATARLRPEFFHFLADFENLVCTRGDRVRLTHDVIAVGIKTGRVKSVKDDRGDPAKVTRIRVDEQCPMEADKSYVIGVRKSDNTTRVINVQTDPGRQRVLTVTDDLTAAQGPDPDDLFEFGEAGAETLDVVIKAIEPAGELTARITCLEYAPAVFDADQGAIPAFQSKITSTRDVGLRPAPPAIRTVQSDLTVAVRGDDGSIQERIVITADPPSRFDPSQVVLQAQLRRVGTDQYGPSVTQGVPNVVVIDNVIGGEQYDLRIRRVATSETGVPGAVSDWSEQPGYTVMGKTDPPDDVTALALEGDRAVWDFEQPLDFAGFKVRFHRGTQRTWANATPAHQGLVTEAEFDVSFLRGGTFTLLVKAIDTGMRESVTPAVITVDLGDPLVENVILTVDYGSFEYGLNDRRGALTGGSLVDGTLLATELAQFWSGVDEALFWTGAANTPFWTGATFAEVAYDAFFVPEMAVLGSDISLVADVAAASHTISYCYDGLESFWKDDGAKFWSDDESKFWSPPQAFRAWPGKLNVTSRQKITFRLTLAPGAQQGIISAFRVIVDVPDVEERLGDIKIGVEGTRLPITQSYREIRIVNATLRADGGSARTVRIVDKNAKEGPLVEALTSGGANTTALIDATVQGF